MRIITDKQLGGTAIMVDGAQDGVEASKAVNESWYLPLIFKYFDITDQGLNRNSTMSDIEDAVRRPWHEGVVEVEHMISELRGANVREPATVRRSRRWSESDGELDVDRAISGEDSMFRESFRKKHTGSETVVLLANMANAASESNFDIFWKGAAMVAAVDILEAAGYSCEVWGWIHWKRSVMCHPADTFIAQKFKEAGDPIDLDGMTKMASAWYQRAVMMKVSGLAGPLNYNCGQSVGTSDMVRDAWVSKYIETTGAHRMFIPAPSYYSYDKKKDAIEITRKIIEGVSLSESVL